MGQRGPEGFLDDNKRQTIIGMLTVGASQARAADYVGCSSGTISNTAKREPQFATQLRQAKATASRKACGMSFTPATNRGGPAPGCWSGRTRKSSRKSRCGGLPPGN